MVEYTYQNKQLISVIPIHDSEFYGYTYDYDNREITVCCNNIFTSRVIKLIFQNTILVHLQSCNFWHGGNSIMWIEVMEDTACLELLNEIKAEYASQVKGSQLDRNIDYFAVELTLNSGDTLQIICEKMIYQDHISEKPQC